MGTNYYLQTEPCPECGRSDDELHIGKSSGGWTFALHVYPEKGIHDLEDWTPLFEANRIRSEYGAKLTASAMLDIITDRGDGPLRREKDGRHCIGHGSGRLGFGRRGVLMNQTAYGALQSALETVDESLRIGDMDAARRAMKRVWEYMEELDG